MLLNKIYIITNNEKDIYFNFYSFLKNKLITVKASDNVIRILPPLNVKKKEIDEGIDIINKTLQEYKS